MPYNLSLAQKHAFDLARTLMIPITLFQVDGQYGVLPSEDLYDADVEIACEYALESGSLSRDRWPLLGRRGKPGRLLAGRAAGCAEVPRKMRAFPHSGGHLFRCRRQGIA